MTARTLRAGLAAGTVFSLGLGLGLGLGTAAAAAESAEVKAPTVNAVWLEREFSFTYMGTGTYYSCGGLENKIEHVLEMIGARRDPKVSVLCSHGTGVQLIPTARIRVAVPAEATPERLAQGADDKSRRELVGRVQGKSAAQDEATAQFPAERRVVEIDGRQGGRIEDGDCELLNQLLPQVLKPLGVVQLRGSRLTCVPKQSQTGAVNLKLESLHAVKLPAAETPQTQ